MDLFLSQLARTIRDGRLLPAGRPLLVAVSGGLDSMVLLHALAGLAETFRWRLVVAHFNHQLRGRASQADERLVAAASKRLGLACHIGHWDVAERERTSRADGLEMAARQARHWFFGEVARHEQARQLVLAHHADDQVETFFLRLFRGASGQGLGGMKAKSRHGPPLGLWVVRPLLTLRRSELAEWAAARRIKFRTDASNADPRFTRNRVRHELLPLLESRFSPHVTTIIQRTMKGLGDDADCLRSLAEDMSSVSKSPEFADAHPALQRQLLVRQLERNNLRFDSQAIEQLRKTAGNWMTLPGGRIIARDEAGKLQLRPAPAQPAEVKPLTIKLSARAGQAELGDAVIQWRRAAKHGDPKFGTGREYFDADRVGDTITLRGWRPGDRFQPIGLPKPVKLQDLFTNARIPREQRHSLIVAETTCGEIFWVEGLRISASFKLHPATRQMLTWRWTRQTRRRKRSC